MPRQRQTIRRRLHGTVMTETVLVSGVLIFIFAWIIYFGRGMVRAQHTAVMDRYEVWRDVGNAPGPYRHDHDHDPHENRLMNLTFFSNNAEDINSHSWNGFPDDAAVEQINASAARSFDTGQMTESAFERFNKGLSISFSTKHDEPVKAFQAFDGPLKPHHTRLGEDWRYANQWEMIPDDEWKYRGGGPSMFAAIRDSYFQALDNQLEGLSSNGNSLAGMMRGLYLHRPPYRGPEVKF